MFDVLRDTQRDREWPGRQSVHKVRSSAERSGQEEETEGNGGPSEYIQKNANLYKPEPFPLSTIQERDDAGSVSRCQCRCSMD